MKAMQSYIKERAKNLYPDNEELQEIFFEGAMWAVDYRPEDKHPKDPNSEQLFEQWWNLYNKKRGRKKALQKWNRLTASQHQAILEATPYYINSISDRQYQKDPVTYLNGECWNDEIIHSNDNRQQQATSLAQKAARILGSDCQ